MFRVERKGGLTKTVGTEAPGGDEKKNGENMKTKRRGKYGYICCFWITSTLLLFMRHVEIKHIEIVQKRGQTKKESMCR